LHAFCWKNDIERPERSMTALSLQQRLDVEQRAWTCLRDARAGLPRQAAVDLDNLAHEAIDSGNVAGNAYALALLAHVWVISSEPAKAERTARDALAAAQQQPLSYVEALALATLSLVINATKLGEAASAALSAERLARDIINPHVQMLVLHALADLYSRVGATHEAIAVRRELLAVSREDGDTMAIAIALAAMAKDLTTLALQAHASLVDTHERTRFFQNAESTIDEALMVSETAQSGYAHALGLLQRAQLQAANLNYAGALSAAHEAEAIAARTGARILCGEAMAVRAKVALIQGQHEIATDLASDVLAIAITAGLADLKLLALNIVADAAEKLGDSDGAARALRRIVESTQGQHDSARELLMLMRDSVGEHERVHVELRHRRSEVDELRQAATELARRTEALIEAGQRDATTRLVSRRRADEVLPQLMDAARLAHQSLAVAIIDVDHLRNINHRFGPTAGDRVLLKIAELTRQQLRESDLAARYGGDELVIFLPRVGSADQARQVADRVVMAVLKQDWQEIALNLTVGVNVGIALLSGPDTAETLRGRAEQALIESRADGVNKVAVASKLDL
jgi:diguanylate cyclase (GGDEF)-like protein